MATRKRHKWTHDEELLLIQLVGEYKLENKEYLWLEVEDDLRSYPYSLDVTAAACRSKYRRLMADKRVIESNQSEVIIKYTGQDQIEALELRVAELIKERNQYYKQLQAEHADVEKWLDKFQLRK